MEEAGPPPHLGGYIGLTAHHTNRVHLAVQKSFVHDTWRDFGAGRGGLSKTVGTAGTPGTNKSDLFRGKAEIRKASTFAKASSFAKATADRTADRTADKESATRGKWQIANGQQALFSISHGAIIREIGSVVQDSRHRRHARHKKVRFILEK
jgi:hypothetical protein